jgi:hypothetical protein
MIKSKRKFQRPGKFWKFKDGTSGILPKRRGQSNEFAMWNKNKLNKHGGAWSSKANARSYVKGTGSRGLNGWAIKKLTTSRAEARKSGHIPILITALDMLKELEKQKYSDNLYRCAATGRLVKYSELVPDHNHTTGRFRGWIIYNANSAEGHFSKLSLEERKEFLKYLENL